MFFINVDAKNFRQEILESQSPVALIFFTVWSGCSHITELIIEELNLESFPSIKFCKINAEENSQIVEEYGIRVIPTILFFYKNEIVDCIEGTFPKTNILGKLKIIQKKYEKNPKKPS